MSVAREKNLAWSDILFSNKNFKAETICIWISNFQKDKTSFEKML
jgi:hypothetical protein